jgi:hypothetical protein
MWRTHTIGSDEKPSPAIRESWLQATRYNVLLSRTDSVTGGRMDSQDLRQKAMDAVRGGSSIQRAAMRFDVGVTAAGRHQHCRSQWG